MLRPIMAVVRTRRELQCLLRACAAARRTPPRYVPFADGTGLWHD